MASDTKEKILDTLLSFYDAPRFTTVSLSKLAAAVGISKAALFKHFANKDDLELCLKNRILNDFSAVVNSALDSWDDENPGRAIAIILNDVINHRRDFFYLLSTCRTFTEDYFVRELRSRGTVVFDTIYDKDFNIINMHSYFLSVYVSTCLLVMLFIVFKVDSTVQNGQTGIDIFMEEVSAFLNDGLSDKSVINDRLALAAIDQHCRETVDALPPSGKLFKAFANVVKKNGYQGVTVEKIAEEMGLAKSSLYSYYKSKEEMLISIVLEETEKLDALVLSNLETVSSVGEFVYTLFSTHTAYFVARPEMAEVIKGLISTTRDKPYCDAEKQYDEQKDTVFFRRIEARFRSLGGSQQVLNSHSVMLMVILYALPVMTFLHCRENNFYCDKKNSPGDYRPLFYGTDCYFCAGY